MTLPIKIKLLSDGAKIPTKANPTDAGWDLYLPETDGYRALSPGIRRAYDIQISLEIPEGWYLRIEPRSGLAVDHGIMVMAGVVDCSYRGSIKVCLYNSSTKDFLLKPGMRIAQATLHRVPDVQWILTDELDQTERGTGGFGSTGE